MVLIRSDVRNRILAFQNYNEAVLSTKATAKSSSGRRVEAAERKGAAAAAGSILSPPEQCNVIHSSSSEPSLNVGSDIHDPAAVSLLSSSIINTSSTKDNSNNQKNKTIRRQRITKCRRLRKTQQRQRQQSSLFNDNKDNNNKHIRSNASSSSQQGPPAKTSRMLTPIEERRRVRLQRKKQEKERRQQQEEQEQRHHHSFAETSSTSSSTRATDATADTASASSSSPIRAVTSNTTTNVRCNDSAKETLSSPSPSPSFLAAPQHSDSRSPSDSMTYLGDDNTGSLIGSHLFVGCEHSVNDSEEEPSVATGTTGAALLVATNSDMGENKDDHRNNLQQIQQAFPKANLHQLISPPKHTYYESYCDDDDQDQDQDEDEDEDGDGDGDEQTLISVEQAINTPNVLRTVSSSSSKQEQKQEYSELPQQQQQQLYEEVQPSASSVPVEGTLFSITTKATRPHHVLTFTTEDFDDADDSVTYEQRKSMERKKARDDGYREDGNSPLVNMEDIEYFRQSLDTPVFKTAAGVVVAATVGTMLLGPVGLLVGTASVGISIGVMQMPEEQRTYVKEEALEALKKTQEQVTDASEMFTLACATVLEESGVIQQVPEEMKHCFASDPTKVDYLEVYKVQGGNNEGANAEQKGETSASQRPVKIISGEDQNLGSPIITSKDQRVACLRNARILPVSQIHGLEPNKQPRAWLDVMASAHTTANEKAEAMEEILILSKDKRNARTLLDEGILDSLLYIIMMYWDTKTKQQQQQESRLHAKLAANCLLTFGKAHCAAEHTGEDQILMNQYEHGRVPEERQLAQLLYEVSHHVFGIDGSDTFILREPTMTQAEEMAEKIKKLVSTT